jgi:hypothetical protein
MKKLYAAMLIGALAVPVACKDFLDVNTNPNAPESVTPNLYLPPLLDALTTSQTIDGTWWGMFMQEWTLANAQTAISPWAQMGYDPGTDRGAQQWRDVYWSMGQNLVDMNTKSEAEQRWDMLGVGQILKAWGWMAITDVHGEIIVKEAFDPTRFAFDYDTQEYAYSVVLSLLDSAITNLQRADGAVDKAYLAKGDNIYAGDRTKWLKYAYGLKAVALSHYSNKSSYKPADVIALVDKSFTSNSDDPLLLYPNTQPSTDRNPNGWTRNNVRNLRQTQFVVNLMNGTAFGGTVDPRLGRMLAIDSANTTYRGLDINVAGYGALTALQQPRNFFGYSGTNGSGLPGKYIFDDKAKLPAYLSYAMLQFVKAEAAFKLGDKVTALAAYKSGISAHIDFVNARNAEISSSSGTPITAAEKAAFLADPNIVPAAANLAISQIMMQKYIAEWGWQHDELFTDMRRYHYTDIDPATGKQVYVGFALPTIIYSDNAGKPSYRVRPRFNSEYVWNRDGLNAIHGLDADYQTRPTWIITPGS